MYFNGAFTSFLKVRQLSFTDRISIFVWTNCSLRIKPTGQTTNVKIRSGHPANDAVETVIDALTIERLVLYLKEPKRKQACWSCADWPQVGYKLTSWNILIVKVRNWSMERT